MGSTPLPTNSSDQVVIRGQKECRIESGCAVSNIMLLAVTNAICCWFEYMLCLSGNRSPMGHGRTDNRPRHRRFLASGQPPSADQPCPSGRGSAEFALVELGAATPKRGRGVVVEDQTPLRVRHVDGNRK